MANEIVLRSATLDDAVRSVSTFNTHRRRLGRTSLGEMGGLSFGGSAAMNQFMLTNSSTAEQLQVTVSDGTESGIAGVLNGVAYAMTDLPLPAGISKFWIYAVDGKIYALNHEFHSDFFPVLLCGTVDVADAELTIRQINRQDNPYVPVCGSEYGAVTLAGELTYANHVLTANYTVAVKGLLNNNAFEFPATAIPASENGALLAYIKLLTVDSDTTAESGFEFASNPSQTVDWYQVMFRYTLTANVFRVRFRQQPLQMFTFTKLYLNASES